MTVEEQKTFYQMLGQHIKNARIKSGLKQEAFASCINLSRVSIVNIEKGRQRPSIHLLFEISKTLKVGLIDLLPNFTFSEEVNPELKKILAIKMKGDKPGQKQIQGFIEEIQLSKINKYAIKKD